jgi:hypothetical protein
LAALLGAGAIAAVIVVVVAGSPSSAAHHATTSTRATPPVASPQVVDDELLGLLGTLASARTRGLTVLSAAHTPSAQASAAAAIASAYRSSIAQFAHLPAAVRASPSAGEAEADLTDAQQAWSALATAAKKANRGAYQRASVQIGSAEQRLRALTQRL